MSGVEPFLASLFAAAGTAGSAGATGAAAASAATAATAATAAGATGAAAAGTVGAAAAAGGGLTALEAIQAGSALSGLAGTASQLLADRPQIPGLPKSATRDAAAEEAARDSLLKKRLGRSAALLTPGGAAGDKSSPTLGAAALLGAA